MSPSEEWVETDHLWASALMIALQTKEAIAAVETASEIAKPALTNEKRSPA